MKVVEIGKKEEEKFTIGDRLKLMVEDIEGIEQEGHIFLMTSTMDGEVSVLYTDDPYRAVGKLELAKLVIIGE